MVKSKKKAKVKAKITETPELEEEEELMPDVGEDMSKEERAYIERLRSHVEKVPDVKEIPAVSNARQDADELIQQLKLDQMDVTKKIKELEKLKKEMKSTSKEADKVANKNVDLSGGDTFFGKFKKKMKRSSKYLINMEMRNGTHRTFTVDAEGDSFKFSGSRYVIDAQLKYFNVDAEMFALDYHQEIDLPIRREIPVKDIIDTIEASQEIEVEHAINPATLERFIISKVAEGVMKGQQIESWIRQHKLMLMITMILSAASLFVLLQSSGFLDGLKLPF